MAEDQDRSNVAAPPPVVYLVGILIGLGLDWVWPLPFLAQPLQYIVGFTIVVLSFVLFGWALREFAQAKTNVNHRRPTTAIVSTGPFARSRNPIYVSMTLLMFGIATAVDSLWLYLMIIPVVLFIHHFVILREEAFLERKFDDAFRIYNARVRRWI